MIGNNPR